MAYKTNAELASLISARLADNTNGDISAQDLTDMFSDLNDSIDITTINNRNVIYLSGSNVPDGSPEDPHWRMIFNETNEATWEKDVGSGWVYVSNIGQSITTDKFIARNLADKTISYSTNSDGFFSMGQDIVWGGRQKLKNQVRPAYKGNGCILGTEDDILVLTPPDNENLIASTYKTGESVWYSTLLGQSPLPAPITDPANPYMWDFRGGQREVHRYTVQGITVPATFRAIGFKMNVTLNGPAADNRDSTDNVVGLKVSLRDNSEVFGLSGEVSRTVDSSVYTFSTGTIGSRTRHAYAEIDQDSDEFITFREDMFFDRDANTELHFDFSSNVTINSWDILVREKFHQHVATIENLAPRHISDSTIAANRASTLQAEASPAITLEESQDRQEARDKAIHAGETILLGDFASDTTLTMANANFYTGVSNFNIRYNDTRISGAGRAIIELRTDDTAPIRYKLNNLDDDLTFFGVVSDNTLWTVRNNKTGIEEAVTGIDMSTALNSSQVRQIDSIDGNQPPASDIVVHDGDDITVDCTANFVTLSPMMSDPMKFTIRDFDTTFSDTNYVDVVIGTDTIRLGQSSSNDSFDFIRSEGVIRVYSHSRGFLVEGVI